MHDGYDEEIFQRRNKNKTNFTAKPKKNNLHTKIHFSTMRFKDWTTVSLIDNEWQEHFELLTKPTSRNALNTTENKYMYWDNGDNESLSHKHPNSKQASTQTYRFSHVSMLLSSQVWPCFTGFLCPIAITSSSTKIFKFYN